MLLILVLLILVLLIIIYINILVIINISFDMYYYLSTIQPTPTESPIENPCTFLPILVTIPDNSCPGTAG